MARDRRQYFDQLAATSRKYYIPYLSQYMKIGEGVNVLEIGCGEGGNLLPFAEAGCSVLGVDLSEDKIRAAEQFFAGAGVQGRFLASDIFAVKELEGQFDLIVCHDVIEHIGDKEEFMRRVRVYLKPGTGLAFIAFPAWQMPFGGHQQMCPSAATSRCAPTAGWHAFRIFTCCPSGCTAGFWSVAGRVPRLSPGSWKSSGRLLR